MLKILPSLQNPHLPSPTIKLEVIEAAAEGVGQETRFSDTVKNWRMYLALKVQHQDDAVHFVRQEASTGEVIYVPAPRVFWGWCWYHINPGCFNPLDPHYSLDTPQGVRIVTGSNIQDEIRPGESYWVAYRHTDSSEPLSSYPGVVIRRMATFNNFFVDKVTLPVNNGT